MGTKKEPVINEACLKENTDKEVETENSVETETFEIKSEIGLVDQLISRIENMPAEIRAQFDYSIAAQGRGVKIPQGGGDIEVTPPRVLLNMTPKKHQ